MKMDKNKSIIQNEILRILFKFFEGNVEYSDRQYIFYRNEDKSTFVSVKVSIFNVTFSNDNIILRYFVFSVK